MCVQILGVSSQNNNTICYISSSLVCNNSFILISTIYLVSLLYYPPNPLSLGSGFFFGPLNAGNSINLSVVVFWVAIVLG